MSEQFKTEGNTVRTLRNPSQSDTVRVVPSHLTTRDGRTEACV